MRLARLTRSPLAFWVAASVVAALTGTVVARLAGLAAAEAARWGDPVTVAVARRTVPAGARIEPGDAERRQVPRSLVPPGALADVPAGRVVTVRVLPGQVLVAAQLAPPGRSRLAAVLPAGHRGLAVPTNGAAPHLEPGDVVDLLATFDVDAGEPTFPVAQGALVLAANPDTVTVAVREADAAPVAYALATGAVTIALAGPGG